MGDEDRTRVLRYAQSYYVTANYDVDAELSAAIPISGLQLLAFNRFVEERKIFTKSQWDKLNTEAEIRTLLTDCDVDTSIPAHFENLENVKNSLSKSADPTATLDALTCIIKMRNSIIHPTRRHPSKWSVYEWVEAGMMSRHFLQMAILHTLGYRHKIRTMTSASRWLGEVQDTPWP